MSMNECIGNEDDIYRGEDEVLDEPPLIVSSSSSTKSSTSSSSSFVAGGRIGAIAAKLEVAIARWAKQVRGTSSTSSSSSTTSSLSSRSRSQLPRKRRRSTASLSSGREIALRITQLKALRESRQILRSFTLYFPPSVMPELQRFQNNLAPGSVSDVIPHTSATTSLSVLLTQLEEAIRILGKQRRQHNRNRGVTSFEEASSSPPRFHQSSLNNSLPSFNLKRTRDRKGKQNENVVKPARILKEPQTKRQAWFLDVSSPTWADLQAIGKLLHIHPLTLEDILQQDPHEKVEDFPNLGYYFISFRTIEREACVLDPSPSTQGLDAGSIGETNVYLTIFIDGICCFHFTDISQHTDRIQNHLLSGNNANMSSDWIAHTILDSIIDSLFPILHDVDQEVRAIDQAVFANTTSPQFQDIDGDTKTQLLVPSVDSPPEKSFKAENTASEKRTPTDRILSYRPRFASPRVSFSLLLRRARRHFKNAWRGLWNKTDITSTTTFTVRRMARAKKLIAVLGRLLNSKSDVITGIKKRLMKAIDSKPIGMAHKRTPEELEIALYMSDIQDHIFALQLSLAHNERMLSHSHPAYMSNLRYELEMTKSDIDIRVLYLSSATITILCIQSLTGIFSMNCAVPHNERDPGGKYTGFSLVLATSAAITLSMIALVYHWWKKAHRRRNPPF